MIAIYVGLFLVASATFVFEICLTRIFSLAQFYHFAFMAVGLALLGYGASGTVLTLRSRLADASWRRRLPWLAMGCGLCMPASYLLTNSLPFDSYSIAWDAKQVGYLLLDYLALAVPFVLSGLVVSIPLSIPSGRANRFYAANLVGSAAGCLLAVVLLPVVGGEATIVAAGFLACLAGVVFAVCSEHGAPVATRRRATAVVGTTVSSLLLSVLLMARPSFLAVRLSPYKALSQALRYPGSQVLLSDWNAYSRVDLVQSEGIRLLPGLSYTYTGELPRQMGITIDGDDLSPVPLAVDSGAGPAIADYLPAAVAQRLRPGADVLMLETRGGFGVWAALANGAATVTAVESNALLVEAARRGASTTTSAVYDDPLVTLATEGIRSFLARSEKQFDIVEIGLAQPYRPVTSGAFSLAEDYVHTVEAFVAYLAHLDRGGILVVTRWLQTPPSETVRTLAVILEALERAGARSAAKAVVAFRGVQTGTFLVKPAGFTAAEMEIVRRFCAERRFDLVMGPGVTAEEINRYNVLPEPYYAQAYGRLMSAADRRAFYADYPSAVAPPTDDRPFFSHYFRWRQTPAVLQTLGKTWQPFGGSGIFVLLALLGLALLASFLLIVAPLLVTRAARAGARFGQGAGWVFAYFGLIGLAYLFVEIPLIQQLILLLGQPVYAMMVVLLALLLFSGLGSLLAPRLPHGLLLWALALAAAGYALLVPRLVHLVLGLPMAARAAIAVTSLAPLGFLMGIPFPKALARLEQQQPRLIPWAWAVNGCASVLSSILAALGALSFGFSVVLAAGAACYAGAAAIIWPRAVPAAGQRPHNTGD